MGFFKKWTGGTDKRLLSEGRLGRADVVGVQASGTSVQMGGGLVERKCTFTLRVMMDGEVPYQATATQRVPEIHLPQLSSGAAVVAVRVDPDDPSSVVIDFASEPPTVRLGRSDGPGSAAHVLAFGSPARAVVVQNQALGMQNADGHDMHALTLTVMAEGEAPYQIQVGNPVPATALPLLYPGSHVHVRRGSGPEDVVVDWDAGPAT